MQQAEVHEDAREEETATVRVLPQSVVFKPTEPDDYALAKIRIKNVSKNKVNVKIALANRSFATSGANCRYPQLSTSIDAYSFIDKNGDI